MEKRDLYDKDKNLTGKTIYKNFPIPKGYYILVVLIFIQNSEGKFLIQKRSKLKNGKFATTGGHPKAGETSIEGAITEVKEEEYELIFDKNSIVNCINFVYEFEDGTRIYTDYTNIKYKKNNIEMSIIDALNKGLLDFDDIKNYEELKIVKKDESKPLECND